MSVKNFACLCGGGLGNIGVPSCVKQADLIVKDIFMNTYANDGTRNSIPITAFDANGVLPSSFLLEKFTEADPSKRWYVTPNRYEEADPTRTDDATQESATGTIKTLREGQLNRSFQLWEVPFSWSAKLNKSTCNEVSVLSIDQEGNLIGEVSRDGSEFYGLIIQKGTLKARSFEKGSNVAYTAVSYQISKDSIEGCFLTIGPDQIEDNLLTSKSLIEVDLTQGDGTNTNTEIFIDAYNGTYGTFSDPFALQGATDTADWKVFTSAGTGGVEIVITAVEEIEKGKYKITLTADAETSVFVSFVKVKSTISEQGYVADQVNITKP